jgi:hypothetical protein
MSARRKVQALQGLFQQIPYATEQGISKAEQGILCADLGTFRVEQGSLSARTLLLSPEAIPPEASSIGGHRRDRSLVQRRSLLAEPEICSAVTRTPRWYRQVCGCRRVGPARETLLFRPPDIAYPYYLGGLQAPPALAQDIRPPATGDVLHVIVDVCGDDLPGWTRCLRHRRVWRIATSAPGSPRSYLFRHGCAVAVVPALAWPPLPRFRRRKYLTPRSTIISTNSALPLFWNYLTLSDGLLTVYEVA